MLSFLLKLIRIPILRKEERKLGKMIDIYNID